jgi:hypothetical protein
MEGTAKRRFPSPFPKKNQRRPLEHFHQRHANVEERLTQATNCYKKIVRKSRSKGKKASDLIFEKQVKRRLYSFYGHQGEGEERILLKTEANLLFPFWYFEGENTESWSFHVTFE